MFLISEEFWEVRKTKVKGLGVFAQKTINKGIVLSDYLGQVIKTAEYDLDLDKNGLYLMYYSDQAAIYPDLDKAGPHLINHSCEPNCGMHVYKGHTLFFSLRNILPNEELTISYLLSPDETVQHVCKCGSPHCTGSMHLSPENYSEWQKLQSRQKTRKSKIVFGSFLPPLSAYPKTISQMAGAKFPVYIRSRDSFPVPAGRQSLQIV